MAPGWACDPSLSNESSSQYLLQLATCKGAFFIFPPGLLSLRRSAWSHQKPTRRGTMCQRVKPPQQKTAESWRESQAPSCLLPRPQAAPAHFQRAAPYISPFHRSQLEGYPHGGEQKTRPAPALQVSPGCWGRDFSDAVPLTFTACREYPQDLEK